MHAGLVDLLPPPGATVLDVGAGSGRDAAWLAATDTTWSPSNRPTPCSPMRASCIRRAASRQVNIQKSNRLVTQAALERASETIGAWWSDAFLSQGDGMRRQFFLEAAQTLPILVASPEPADVIDAMKVHRIRLGKAQGLRPWEPPGGSRQPLLHAGGMDSDGL